MSRRLWRQLTRGVRALTQRSAADRDVADEVRHYFEETVSELEASGLSPEEARRVARLELGSPSGVREDVRAYGWENAVATLLADLRQGARRLRSRPGFATVGVLTLALGLGASTAIFSAVNPILFEPLPYPHADRVVTLSDRGTDGSRIDVTFGTYREVTERSRSFQALAVVKPWQPVLAGTAEPERLDGQRVSAAYFKVLGMAPALGRDFDASEDRYRGARVAILSQGLWRRRFGADPAIVGRQVTLDGDPTTVVGVMPSGLEDVLLPSAELWTPLQYDASLPSLEGREWGHHLRMVGRLRAGVSEEAARRELDRIAKTPVPEFSRPPWASLPQGLLLGSLQDDVTRAVKPALLAIFGAVLLVLAIACVNVTHLLMARGAERRGEFAMRAALGAPRGRLVRQLLTESLLLALLAGGVGLVVAAFGVRALVALSPPELPRVEAILIDGPVFAAALAITTLVGLAVGVLPALHGSRSDLQTALEQGSRRTSGRRPWTRAALVVAEVALALVLLVSAGLLLRSLQRLFAVDPGFDASHLLTLQVQTSGHRFDDDSTTHRFFARALDAVRDLPGVAGAAFTSQLPLSGDLEKYGVQLESSPDDDSAQDHSALRYAVSPGYLETLRIPLRRGRPLDEHDRAGAPVAVLVSEAFARHRFPGRDPIGQRVHVGRTDLPWFTIVGVVGDVKQTSLALGEPDAVYVPTTQWYAADRTLSLVVRARGDAAAIAPAVRNAIWSVDKDPAIVRVATMDGLVARSAAQRRFVLTLFEAFAMAALVLAAIGIYGVVSGSVTERTREIGVRSALGASRADIVALVVGQGLTLAGLGVVIGLAGAVAASRAILGLLFGVSWLDPITYLGVVGMLLGVSAIACWMPAWRAARLDPSIPLRAE